MARASEVRPRAGGPLRLAAIFSMSGEAEHDNAGSVAGVEFAAAQLNKRGGLLGRPVQLVMLDNRSNAAGSRAAALAAVQAGAFAIIGASWSFPTRWR